MKELTETEPQKHDREYSQYVNRVRFECMLTLCNRNNITNQFYQQAQDAHVEV